MKLREVASAMAQMRIHNQRQAQEIRRLNKIVLDLQSKLADAKGYSEDQMNDMYQASLHDQFDDMSDQQWAQFTRGLK